MIEAIVKAASIPRYVETAEPFVEPTKCQHAIIVGGTHLVALAGLFPQYALSASVVIPATGPVIDMEHEFERALEFEDQNEKRCKGVGIAHDLGGFDSDSADFLFVCTLNSETRDKFLAQASRVVKDQGKVILFTPVEIPITHLAKFGIAAPTYYATEGFYVGTMRQAGSLYRRN
jgi:hypothetical protein